MTSESSQSNEENVSKLVELNKSSNSQFVRFEDFELVSKDGKERVVFKN